MGHKQPPHDNELEKAVLSCIFHSRIKESRLQPEDFFGRAHQRIYEGMLSVLDKELSLDLLALKIELGRKGSSHLDESGGLAYISSILNAVPSSANYEYYVRAVKDHSLRRDLLRLAGEIGKAAYDEALDMRQILADVKAGLEEITVSTEVSNPGEK